MADNRLKAVATARAYDQGNIANLDDAMTRRLVASTVLTESFGGDLDPINRLGYVGRYQAGAAWLVDAGYIDLDKYREAHSSMTPAQWERGGGQLRFMQNPANWNNGLSLDQYLASDDLQDAAFRINSNRSYAQAIRNGLLTEDASQETVAGFLKSRHLSGYAGARNAVQGGRVVRDENGTSNYDYLHDITRNRDGLNEMMGRSIQQPTNGQQPQRQTNSRQETVPEEERGPRSFNDVMHIMLPPQNGIHPHLTSDYGPRRVANGSSDHKGVDFNYVGGQAGINLRHPTVRSPVSGTVEMPENSAWNTVGIRDAQGNLHQILHLDARSVRNGQPIAAGDPIGTMGNTNNRDPNMAQHVHYQIRDRQNAYVDPERFWDNRAVQGTNRDDAPARAATASAMSDGVLKLHDRGPEVQALQRALNALGYRGSNGQPLETGSGVFGPHTRHAVEAFQRAHGLKVDGEAGRLTLPAVSAAGRHPLVSEATHPNHALFNAVTRALPPGTRPEVAANVTLQAMENGVSSVDRLAGIHVRGTDVFVQGKALGERAKVDLAAPTPDMQAMSEHMQRQSQSMQSVSQVMDVQAQQSRGVMA